MHITKNELTSWSMDCFCANQLVEHIKEELCIRSSAYYIQAVFKGWYGVNWSMLFCADKKYMDWVYDQLTDNRTKPLIINWNSKGVRKSYGLIS